MKLDILSEELGLLLLMTGGVVLYVLQDGVLAVWSMLVVLATAVAVKTGTFQRAWTWLNAWRLRHLRFGPEVEPGLQDVFFGVDERTVTAVYQNLAHTGHIFISGQTRFGKTTLLHALVDDLVTRHAADEIKICFSDPKRTSFSIYGRLPHLFCPIARSHGETQRMIDLARAEMERRMGMFGDYAEEHVCTNLVEYAALSGDELPRIVLIFDELADSVARGSEAERKLTTLAKMGLAYGINLILATQRPTAEGISHEVQSQCSTFLSTYMRSAAEYGAITKIPKKVYSQMTPNKGRFMVYSPELAAGFAETFSECGGWGFIQGALIPSDKLAANARRLSAGRARTPRPGCRAGRSATGTSRWPS